MKPKSTLRPFLAALGASVIAVSSAQAASATWDTNADGNWTAVANWTGDTAYAEGADNTATFGDFISANRIITLDANITIGNITASDATHNYTISGANILTLDRTSGIPVIDVTTAGRTLTISSQISGADGLQKNGAGTLTLSSTANDYTGGIVINAGTLSIGANTNLGNAANTITLNGGELYINQGSTDVSSARDVILNDVSGNQIRLQGNQDWTNSGAFTGDGGVTFRQSPSGNVSATLTSTSNTFKGALEIVSGGSGITVKMRSLADSATANGNIIFSASTNSQVFEWDSAGGTNNDLTLAYRDIEFAGNGNASGTIRKTSTTQALNISSGISATGTGTKTLVLDINGTTNNEISGIISDGTAGGTVGINKPNTSGGTLVLSGNNSYTGSTVIGSGTISVSTLADFGENSGLGAATSGGIVIGNTTGSGTLTYTGGTQSTNRTIRISGWDQANGGGATITNNGSGKLTFTAATFNESYTANSTTTRPLTLRGSNDGEIQGTIQDGGSNINGVTGLPFLQTSLTKNDGGTWTLSGANTYNGTTTVSGGTLQFAKQTSLYNNNTANWTKTKITVNSGTTVAFNVGGTGEFSTGDVTTLLGGLGGTVNNNGLRSGSSIGFDTTNASGGTFTISDSIANTTGTGGGAVGLTKLGTGTLELTNTNTYGGATTVTGGTLAVTGSGSINSTSGVTINTGGELRYGSTTGLNRNVTLSGGTFRYNSSTNYSGTLTYTSGTLAGTNLNGASFGTQTIGAGKSISPGNSPGTMSVGSQTWAADGSYLWEINDATGTAGIDPGWDLLSGTGTLDITALDADPFVILVTSLTLSNSAGLATNFNPSSNYSWLIADFDEITGFTGSNLFSINTAGFQNSFTGGSFGITMLDNGGTTATRDGIYLTYTAAIPEPGAALLGGLGMLALLRRRRSA